MVIQFLHGYIYILFLGTHAEYEECHFPIGQSSLADVVKMRLEQEAMSQREFANKLGVSPSRVSDYLTGKCEPTLKIARNISKILNIEPAIILGL